MGPFKNSIQHRCNRVHLRNHSGWGLKHCVKQKTENMAGGPIYKNSKSLYNVGGDLLKNNNHWWGSENQITTHMDYQC